MKTKKTLIVIFFLILFSSAFYFYINYSVFGNRKEKIIINNYLFEVERVSSPEKMKKGLSERSNLCENCGMIFEFRGEGQRSFWMKGMRFPLDIIWIDGENIVYIAKEVPANYQDTITPENPADKVLEINAGLVDKYEIKTGDEIKFQ